MERKAEKRKRGVRDLSAILSTYSKLRRKRRNEVYEQEKNSVLYVDFLYAVFCFYTADGGICCA